MLIPGNYTIHDAEISHNYYYDTLTYHHLRENDCCVTSPQAHLHVVGMVWFMPLT